VAVTAGEVLRLCTMGSVDDGKSTLIGRLLYDCKLLLDELAHVRDASARRGWDGLDLSLVTDGLRAEREQGMTIDVAHRYFATPRRRFILADTPGHGQYTRNTVPAHRPRRSRCSSWTPSAASPSRRVATSSSRRSSACRTSSCA